MIAIPVLIILINISLAKKIIINYEKISPYLNANLILYHRIQFFLIRIIFLIFDTEIILLIPLIVTTSIPTLILYIVRVKPSLRLDLRVFFFSQIHIRAV